MNPDEYIGIEEEFRKSWAYLEGFYAEGLERGYHKHSALLSLIREMQMLGYDEWFYASESRGFLVLTRSYDGSFSLDKNWLCIGVNYPDGFSALASIAGKRFYIDNQPVLLTKVLKLLLELLMVQDVEG